MSVVGTGSTAYLNFSGSTANVLYFSTNTFRSVSFVTWISSSISGINYIFDGRDGIGAYLYYAGTGGISALYVNGASKDPTSTSNNTTVFPRNQWLNIYIELSSIGTGAVSFGNRVSFNEPFTGRMSAFQFYNRQLTAAEIKQNYDAFRGRYS